MQPATSASLVSPLWTRRHSRLISSPGSARSPAAKGKKVGEHIFLLPLKVWRKKRSS